MPSQKERNQVATNGPPRHGSHGPFEPGNESCKLGFKCQIGGSLCPLELIRSPPTHFQNGMEPETNLQRARRPLGQP